jgi:hypothetical protein
MEKDTVSETLYSLVFENTGQQAESKEPLMPMLIHHFVT